jgi:hypothetical protein
LLYLYKLRVQTTSKLPITQQRHLWHKHHQLINLIFAPPQHSPAVRHFLTTLLSSSTPSSHSANMADMDTYDNEPRTSGYDGMPYTYSPYANRRICSYNDLDESNTPSSDPWFRASEGDFNIYPHSRQSWHATPLRPFHLLTSLFQTTRAAATVRALVPLALTAMATPAFATTPTAAASGKHFQPPSAALDIQLTFHQ